MRRLTVLIQIFAAVVLLSSRAKSQFVSPPLNAPPQFNENNAIGLGAIDDTAFYCYWPAWSVTKPVVTAVELTTGNLLWSVPARMAQNLAFLLEDGWLHFETIDDDPQLSELVVSYHMVNCRTGADIIIRSEAERYSEVIRPVIHRGRAVTPQGLVVRCDDGSTVGDLGTGTHQVFAWDGKLYSMPFESPAMLMERRSVSLKRYDIETMQLEREIHVKDRNPLSFVAATRDMVVVRNQIDLRRGELVCFNFAEGTEVWRVTIPSGVQTSKCQWVTDSRFALTMGSLGPIQPMHVDIETGAMAPDLTWRDPRSLLAWHFNSSYFPDLFTMNDELIVGRWRTQRLICINAKTGEEIWRHSNHLFPAIRLFFQSPKMGAEIVAESDNGFDIISVATAEGSRRRVTPDQLGLIKNTKPARSSSIVRLENEARNSGPSSDSTSDDSVSDWMKDWGTVLWPVIPLIFWMIWSLVRLRYPAPKTGRHIV